MTETIDLSQNTRPLRELSEDELQAVLEAARNDTLRYRTPGGQWRRMGNTALSYGHVYRIPA